MPTYNYRLTGRDISTLSPVESTDRILLWGANAIHCSSPGCKFEICAVGGENVLGGAMQEGWTFDPNFNHNPFRCNIHPSPAHHPITPEFIAEKFPVKSPEYMRGHADGFEEAHKRMVAPTPAYAPAYPQLGVGTLITGTLPGPNTYMEFPDATEIERSLILIGGLDDLSRIISEMQMGYGDSHAFRPLIAGISAIFNASKTEKRKDNAIESAVSMGVILASMHFNSRYGKEIAEKKEMAAEDPNADVQ